MTTATRNESRRIAGLAYETHGAGTPVVFLHGLTFDRTTWRPVIERLGEGVQAIAVDLPGHGESDGPPVSLDVLAGRVHELLSGLGIDRPLVVGHSIGGFLAFLYAVGYPTIGIVDVDQGLDARRFSALLKELEPALRGPGFDSVFERFQESMEIDRVPEPDRSLVLGAQRVRQDLVLGYWDNVINWDADKLQQMIDQGLAALDVPFLAVFGRPLEDEPGHGLRLVRNLELEEWVGDGHLVHLVEPDRFAARLRAFVERCAGKTLL
jgi:pimeloyl-ACP methyl ester carboxylesterase